MAKAQQAKQKRIIRMSGVPLPSQKHIHIALQSIYGVGPSVALELCASSKISPNKKVQDLTDQEETSLREAFTPLEGKVEGNLRREVAMALKRLREIKCYRALRHMKGLPVRGQRSKTNAKTRKRRRGRPTTKVAKAA